MGNWTCFSISVANDRISTESRPRLLKVASRSILTFAESVIAAIRLVSHASSHSVVTIVVTSFLDLLQCSRPLSVGFQRPLVNDVERSAEQTMLARSPLYFSARSARETAGTYKDQFVQGNVIFFRDHFTCFPDQVVNLGY